MKIHLEAGEGTNIIRSYAPGAITINQRIFTANLLVMPDRIIENWAPQGLAGLGEEDFRQIADLAPELVLLGTGGKLIFPKPVCTAPLVVAQIGLEVMGTAAACRTYNILMSEGRRVLAALLMIEGNQA